MTYVCCAIRASELLIVGRTLRANLGQNRGALGLIGPFADARTAVMLRVPVGPEFLWPDGLRPEIDPLDGLSFLSA